MTNPPKKITPDLPVRREMREILKELPLSERQRALYQSGADKMSDEDVGRNLARLKRGLDGAPAALEAARELLRRRRPKPPGL